MKRVDIKHLFSKSSGIQKKVILLYLLTSVLPIILISILAVYFYYQEILNEALKLVEENSYRHELLVNERLENYQEKLYEIITDAHVIKATEAVNESDPDISFAGRQQLATELKNDIYSLNQIRSITFIGEKGESVSAFQGFGSITDIVWSQKKVRSQIYEKVSDSKGITYMSGINLAAGENRSDYVILLGIEVHNLHTNEKTGVMILALDDSVLNFDSNRNVNLSKTDAKSGITTLIINEKEQIIASEEEKYIGTEYFQYLSVKFPNKKSVHELYHTFVHVDWKIINLIDMDTYLQNIYSFAKIVLTITVCITLVFFLLLYLISRRYIRTVKKIAQGISAYSGNSKGDIEVDVDEEDELYLIARQFNKMIKRVDQLVTTLQKKNQEIKEALLRQKHAEIKALEAQINPHFLFNTLDSINWRAIEHEEEEISNMLSSLGSLLRYSISNIESIVILEAEICWLRKYVYLQRERFNHSFDCTFDVEEESLGFPIYKMLLQPLVENIILHGFEGIEEDGMIFVQTYIQENGKLCIRIQDNGVGIEREMLETIQKEIQGGVPLNGKNIGISNVVNRLKIYYHGNAELKFTSVVGEGTEIVMVIPPFDEDEGD